MDEARAIGPRGLWLLSGILILLLAVGGLLLFLSATSAHAASPQKGCSEKSLQTSVKGDDGQPSSVICIDGKQTVYKGATTCMKIKGAQGKVTTDCKPGGNPPIGRPGNIKGTIACKTFKDSNGKVTTSCTCSGVQKASTNGGDGKSIDTQPCGCPGGQPTTVKNDKGKITVTCGEPGKMPPPPDES